MSEAAALRAEIKRLRRSAGVELSEENDRLIDDNKKLRAAIDQSRKLAWSNPVECEQILTRALGQKEDEAK
jgi:hypothetical protein